MTTEFTTEQANAITLWTFERMTLVLDNDAEAHEPIMRAARRAMEAAGDAPSEVVRKAIGEAVTDAVRVQIIRHATRAMRRVLEELLDLNDEKLIELLGDHYTPED